MSSLFQQFLQQHHLTTFLQQADSLYLQPNIPIKKIQGAMYYLPAQTRADEILLLVDNTVFGSAKAGLCLTEQYLFIREDFDDLISYRLDQINKIDTTSGMINTDLVINSSASITLTQMDRKDIQMLAELLWQFVQLQRQSTHSRYEQPHTQGLEVFVSALHVLIYIATKFKGPFSADSFALMQDLLKACHLERQVDLNRMLQQSRPAFVIVAQQLAKGSSQLSDMQKRLLFKCAIQLMYINQYGYLDFQRQTEDFCTFLNISFPDMQKAIEEALTEQTQQTEETAPDEDVEPLNDELLKACQLLDLQPHQLNSSSLQTAYRRKIAEFHPDQYQSLPQAVRQLIEQQAQQLNQARDLLRSYLQAG